MRLLIYSDLHFEFDRSHDHAPFTPPPDGYDVAILAGDIDVSDRGITWAKAAFSTPVLYVIGNHEYYKDGHWQRTPKRINATANNKVTLLNMHEAVIDNVRFLGTTLWTDYALGGDVHAAMDEAQNNINDFRHIREGLTYSKLRSSTVLAAHQRERLWLKQKLAEPFRGKTVVVTHHAPHPESLQAQYPSAALRPAYASDLSDLIGPPIDLWVHGHTHASHSYHVNGTRIVCNARGYFPNALNRNFDPQCILEI
jgi:predicted phosphodiesterase